MYSIARLGRKTTEYHPLCVAVAIRNGSGIMHNKFSVIDDNFVATGSFNYSANADTRNEENLVFIQSAEIANQFEKDFNK